MKDLFGPKEVVRSGLCIGCGSCVAQANAPEVQMQWDDYGQLKPRGPSDWYGRATDRFAQTCPFSPVAKKEDEIAEELFPAAQSDHNRVGRFQTAYVGYAAEDNFRLAGSSGGMVSWVAAELLRKGLVDGVAHVVPADPHSEGRYFQYRLSHSEAEVKQGAKSRYYPVELSGILGAIRDTPGRYAVVGIPCFIKAINLLRNADPLYKERIPFTLGLFCGHMKSARFVESFAWQLGVPAAEVAKVEFRYKDPNRPANWYNAMLTLRNGQVVNRDWWHLADGDWGGGFFMNSACNYCDDVVAETADVSFGDAWVEPYSSDGKGTNVVVVRSPVVQDMVAAAIAEERLQLKVVDGNFVEQTQAAGFRQRREGLAYRLTWSRTGVKPCKRVVPDAHTPAPQRKRIYRFRFIVSAWSHRVFWLAKKLRFPKLYIGWARLTLALYHGLAYHNGKFSEMKKRFDGLKRQ